MLEKLCTFLTQKMREENPDIDEERAEAINFGLQNLFGEIPKTFVMLFIAYILGIFQWSLFTFLALYIYKGASGGVHLKTHIGCLLFTCTFYCIIPFISKYIVMTDIIKYMVILSVWIFGMIMIKLYAPADTENVPILSKKVRKKKQIVSYISFTIGLLVAAIVPNSMICNILILANLFQTITITKFVYKITNNKYGYEVYGNTSSEIV